MTIIEIIALTCVFICQYSAGKKIAINRITAVLLKAAESQAYCQC